MRENLERSLKQNFHTISPGRELQHVDYLRNFSNSFQATKFSAKLLFKVYEYER